MRRHLRLALLLPLAACAQPDANLTQEALEAALASQRAGLGAAGPAADAAPMPGGVLTTARPGPQADPPNLARELVGQTPEGLRRLLGEPRLRRAEDGAEIWHYQASQCHLDLVLYPDQATRPVLRVAFAQARAAGTARRSEAACLRDIARGAARPATPSLTEQAAARA